MSLKTIAWILALFCLFEVAYSETRKDVINKYFTKLNDFKTELRKGIHESSNEISIGKSRIEETLANGKKLIKQYLTDVKIKANEVSEQTEIDEENTKDCLKKFNETIKKLNTELPKSCYYKDDVTSASKSKSNLKKFTETTDNIVENCVSKFPLDKQIDGLKKCIEDNIKNINNKAIIAQNNISNIILSVMKENETCVSKAVKNITDHVDIHYKNFKICVMSGLSCDTTKCHSDF